MTAIPASPVVVMFSTPAFPRCDAHRYALSARQVAGVAPSMPLIRVPGGASRVAGLIAWRGEVMPVVDFRSEVERLAAAGPEPRLLMVRVGARFRGHTVAFPVHPLMTLHRPTGDDREEAGHGPKPPFVASFFGVAGDRVALLNLDELIGSE
jgi:chemotaxis signal transduction protein